MNACKKRFQRTVLGNFELPVWSGKSDLDRMKELFEANVGSNFIPNFWIGGTLFLLIGER